MRPGLFDACLTNEDGGSRIRRSASVCSGAATPYTLIASDLGVRGVVLLRRRTWPRKRGHGTHRMLIAAFPAYQNDKNHPEIRAGRPKNVPRKP